MLIVFGVYGLYSLFGIVFTTSGCLVDVLSKAVRDVNGAIRTGRRAESTSVFTVQNVDGSDSGSTGADAPGVVGGSWVFLVKAQTLCLYVMEVGAALCNTIALMCVTCLMGALSWVDWCCTLMSDIVTRVYSDPRGLIFHL